MPVVRTMMSVVEFVPKAIMDALTELSRLTPLSTEDKMDLTLLLEEALTNAIKHGNQYDTSKVVELTIDHDGQGNITMVIKDQGNGFNPAHIRNLQENNEQMNDSGRGIFLMRQMADEVKFNERGNEITILKKIKGK